MCWRLPSQGCGKVRTELYTITLLPGPPTPTLATKTNELAHILLALYFLAARKQFARELSSASVSLASPCGPFLLLALFSCAFAFSECTLAGGHGSTAPLTELEATGQGVLSLSLPVP